MDAKWERFDNTLSDLWNFFIPPILNAIVILMVFPNVPKYIWGGIGFIITEIRAIPDNHVITGSLPDLLGDFTKNSTLFTSISDSAISAVISTVVTLAILIFVIHKVVLISSRLLFGQIDLNEESLNAHPKVAKALVKLRAYLPDNDVYYSVHRAWEYTRTINDKRDNLNIYRCRRMKIITGIESNRVFARYSSAYFLLSIVSLFFVEFSVVPLIILISTIVLFLLFSKAYVNACVDLLDLDIYTFLSLVNYDGLEPKAIDDELTVNEDPYFIHHVRLFDGNIFSVFRGVIKG
jgi:hypothetical protein